MKLGDTKPDQIVKNTGNRRLYKMVENLEDRTRIRPLEIFPNGLVVQKPTDTIVASDIDVQVIGLWTDEKLIRVVGVKKQTEPFLKELATRRDKLAVLEAELGVSNKGAHAMKLMAIRTRIETLERGLKPIRTKKLIQISMEAIDIVPDQVGANVRLANGSICQVTGVRDGVFDVTCGDAAVSLSAGLVQPVEFFYSSSI